MAGWINMVQSLPMDGEECWIRVYPWQVVPIHAKWQSSTSDWYIVANGLILPWWTVAKWKAYP